ncbi:unnamed protein product [Ectocarpus sp. CCAP 1310/34]|nr:unnamed protein product [Ectocarpus sp. CCAP 1310/34]
MLIDIGPNNFRRRTHDLHPRVSLFRFFEKTPHYLQGRTSTGRGVCGCARTIERVRQARP